MTKFYIERDPYNKRATSKRIQRTPTAAGAALGFRTINKRLLEAGLVARRSKN